MAKKEFTGPPLKPNGGPTTLKAWWNCSDAKTWLDVNEAMAVDPVAGQELQEALALYQDKVRAFKKSKHPATCVDGSHLATRLYFLVLSTI